MNDASRASGSSHPAIHWSVFGWPRMGGWISSCLASAAESADTVPRAADSNTAPTVSKPALFRQRAPLTNFPAWPGQSSVQPLFVEKSLLPIFPRFQASAAESADTVPRAATAPVSKPAVFLVEPWTIQSVQTHRQHLLPILPTLPISSALPIPTLHPPCLNQRCFVSVPP